MDALEAYLRGGQPKDYRSLTQFQNLLTQLGTYENNRSAYEALGAEAPKPSKGVLSWVLGDVLGAPAKKVRSIVLGDPTKTGGDVFRVEDDDSLPEKIGKYAGALAVDVATDPLSYFGSGTSLGRKALATTGSRLGGKMLDEAAKIAPTVSSSGLSKVDEVVETLFRNSDAYQRATAGVGDVSLLDEALDPAVKRTLAERELGRVFGESILGRGRKGAVDDLSTIFGDRDLAVQVIRSLGPEFEGGVWLTTPFGRPIRRLTPGTGELLGPLQNVGNTARRKVSQITSGPISKFNTKYGGVWRNVVAGVDPVTAVGENLVTGTKESISQYVDLIDFDRAQKSARLTRRVAGASVVFEARARKQELAEVSKEQAEEFYLSFVDHYNHPFKELPANATPVYQEAADYARKLHDAEFEVAQEAYNKGVINNPPRWGHVALIKKEDAISGKTIEDIRRAGPGKPTTRYNPSGPRSEYVVYDPDLKSAALRGTYLDEDAGLVALSPVNVNSEIGREDFLIDPISIHETNVDALTSRIIAADFAADAIQSGIVIRDPRAVNALVDEARSGVYRDLLRKISPEVADRVTQAEQAAAKRLEDQLTTGLAKETSEQAQARLRTKAEKTAAKQLVRSIEREVKQRRADIAKLRPTVARTVRKLRSYANQKVEQQVEEARNAARNAGKRVNTAQRAADKTAARVDKTGTVQAVLRDDAAQAELASRRMTLDEQLYELEFARMNRDEVRAGFAADELAQYDKLQALNDRLVQLERDLAEARKLADDADVAFRTAWAGPSLDTIRGVQEHVLAYISARNALKTLEQTYDFTKRDTISTAVRGAREEAERTVKEAERRMRTALKVARKGRENTAVGQYAEAVIRMAENLSDAQLVSAMVISSDERLARVLDEIVLAKTPREQDVAAGRIIETYNQIRRFVKAEDLEVLNEAESALLGEVNARAAEREMRSLLVADELRSTGYATIGPEAPEIVIPKGLDSVFASNGIREFLEVAYRVENNPDSVKRFMEQTVEPLLLLWKSGVTVLRGPSYVINNTVGGILHNHYMGTSIKDMSRNARFMRDMIKAFRSKELRKLDIHTRMMLTQVELAKKWNHIEINGMGIVDLLRWYVVNSGMADSQTASVVRRLIQAGGDIEVDPLTGMPRKLTSVNDTVKDLEKGTLATGRDAAINTVLGNRVSIAATDGAQLSELWLRFSAFAEGYRRYGNLNAALDLADLYHFNYENLSEAERALRRFIPFYSWTRNNVPLQLRVMFLQPGKINKFLYAQQEAGKAFGADEDDTWLNQVLPAYIQEAGGFATGVEGAGGNLAFSSRLPFSDVDRLLRVGGMPVNLRELGNMVGPAALPLQLATGTNPATGAAFNEAGIEAPGYLKWLQYTGIGQRGKYGEYRMPEPLFYALTESIPFIGTAERAVSGLAELVDIAGAEGAADVLRKVPSANAADRGLSNLLNFAGAGALMGGSFSTLTPNVLTGELRRRSTRQLNDLYNVAASRGVSLEWVKDQLRAGSTPEEVKNMIARGQGKRQQYEQEKIAGSKGPSERYLDIISRLGQGR